MLSPPPPQTRHQPKPEAKHLPPQIHVLSLALVTALLWILLSGHFEPLLLGLGAFSVLLVVALNLRMELTDHESHPLHFGLAIIPYWAWLMKELLLSNLDVIKRIWLGNNHIHPVVKRLPVSQKSDMCQVIYANSITLTPGTVTIDLDDNSVLVHALSEEGMAALETGEMDRRVAALER
ncbi:MAG: Na+/H+ antiporter subunit E [Gammaproteobacteria bacterium]|nr:Na+/H+ antiporter subunit E [Gammaproteobacteria bacterium]